MFLGEFFMLESILVSILIDLSHNMIILREFKFPLKIALFWPKIRVRFSESSNQLALKIRWLRDLKIENFFKSESSRFEIFDRMDPRPT